MVLSRGITLTNRLIKFSNRPLVQSIRNSSHAWTYRTAYVPPKQNIIIAEVFGGFMWWWILWHLFTEPGHVFGEWNLPDPSKWTNEELGIPPDDAD